MHRKFVAFLGGINVGGHRVTMERLRAEFEALDFADVWTFIASGNVVFRAPGGAAALEERLETHLASRLGWPVPTFVREAAAVVEIAGREPFAIGEADTHLVGFLREAPAAAAKRAAEALSNERDLLVVQGAELHWRIHGNVLDSSIKAAVLARAIVQPMTTRNTVSLRKLAAKL